MKCCKSRNCCSKDNFVFLLIIGIIAVALKVVALIDLFKKRKRYSRRKKAIITALILIFPPAPLIYLIIVNLKKDIEKTENEDNYESVNLNKEEIYD